MLNRNLFSTRCQCNQHPSDRFRASSPYLLDVPARSPLSRGNTESTPRSMRRHSDVEVVCDLSSF